jgi:hypothetical protein
MTSGPAPTDRLAEAAQKIPTCALDQDGIERQRHAGPVVREPDAVAVQFRPGFDRDALDEALAVERQCCPFFEFEFGASDRRLRVTVKDQDQLAALDVIAEALSASGPRSPADASPPNSG